MTKKTTPVESIISICIIILLFFSVFLAFSTINSKKTIHEFGNKIILLEKDLIMYELNTSKLLVEVLKESQILNHDLMFVCQNKLDLIFLTISDMSCTTCVEKKISFAEKYKNDKNYRIVLITSESMYEKYKPYERLNSVGVIKSKSVIDFFTSLGFKKSLVIRCNNELLPEQVLFSEDTDIIDDFFKNK